MRSRPIAGERDLLWMYDLTAASPERALHLADLPWRLVSPSAQTAERTRLCEDEAGALLAWTVLQFPWHCVDYAGRPGPVTAGMVASVLAWATERLDIEAEAWDEPLRFYVGARTDDPDWRRSSGHGPSARPASRSMPAMTSPGERTSPPGTASSSRRLNSFVGLA